MANSSPSDASSFHVGSDSRLGHHSPDSNSEKVQVSAEYHKCTDSDSAHADAKYDSFLELRGTRAHPSAINHSRLNQSTLGSSPLDSLDGLQSPPHLIRIPDDRGKGDVLLSHLGVLPGTSFTSARRDYESQRADMSNPIYASEEVFPPPVCNDLKVNESLSKVLTIADVTGLTPPPPPPPPPPHPHPHPHPGAKSKAEIENGGSYIKLPADPDRVHQRGVDSESPSHMSQIKIKSSPSSPTPISTTRESSTNDINLGMEELKTMMHDGIAHHPLGAGSYYFKSTEKFGPYFLRRSQGLDKGAIVVRLGAQPNSSPHIGNIISFSVAFFFAKTLKEAFASSSVGSGKILPIRVSFDIVDTAPSIQQTINGVTYQKSQRFTEEMKNYMPDFEQVLKRLSERTTIPYQIRTQEEFLSHPDITKVIRKIVDNREEWGRDLSPDHERLAIRTPCPKCGWADKHGINNVYEDDKIHFECPHHGRHSIDISNPEGVSLLEFNTPVRNLLRILHCSQDKDTAWIHITGADYSGVYQEQFMWSLLDAGIPKPVIFYAPLVTDWSGGKISKSLYVKQGAYEYLNKIGLDYFVSFEIFKSSGKDLRPIFDEVERWFQQPKKLFRSYSIYYFHALISEST